MARYLQTAAEANERALELFDLISPNLNDQQKAIAACYIARLVNYGLRCAPRAVQSTVRLNAVKRAVEGLPVAVSMEKRVDEDTGRTYNILITEPITNVGS